jgi:hypothetical protein
MVIWLFNILHFHECQEAEISLCSISDTSEREEDFS